MAGKLVTLRVVTEFFYLTASRDRGTWCVWLCLSPCLQSVLHLLCLLAGKNAAPSLAGSGGGGGFRWEVGAVFLCVSVRYVRIRHQPHRDLGGRRRVLLPSLSACGPQRENRGSVPPAMRSTGWMVCGPALSSSRSTCSVLDTLDRKLSGGQRLTPPSTSEDAGAQWVWHSVQ